MTLDNKVCLSKSAATSVHTLESLGQGQFKDFNTNVLESTNVKLEAPIKRNNLILFTETTKRKPAAVHGRVQHFKEQADLFGKAFLVLESRGGNLTEFFRHESAIYPPALSSRGKMNSCTKSDLLNCILDADTTSNCRPFWINFLLLQARSSKHPHRFVKQHKISYVRCMTVMACLQPDKAATTTLIL